MIFYFLFIIAVALADDAIAPVKSADVAPVKSEDVATIKSGLPVLSPEEIEQVVEGIFGEQKNPALVLTPERTLDIAPVASRGLLDLDSVAALDSEDVGIVDSASETLREQAFLYSKKERELFEHFNRYYESFLDPKIHSKDSKEATTEQVKLAEAFLKNKDVESLIVNLSSHEFNNIVIANELTRMLIDPEKYTLPVVTLLHELKRVKPLTVKMEDERQTYLRLATNWSYWVTLAMLVPLGKKGIPFGPGRRMSLLERGDDLALRAGRKVLPESVRESFVTSGEFMSGKWQKALKKLGLRNVTRGQGEAMGLAGPSIPPRAATKATGQPEGWLLWAAKIPIRVPMTIIGSAPRTLFFGARLAAYSTVPTTALAAISYTYRNLTEKHLDPIEALRSIQALAMYDMTAAFMVARENLNQLHIELATLSPTERQDLSKEKRDSYLARLQASYLQIEQTEKYMNTLPADYKTGDHIISPDTSHDTPVKMRKFFLYIPQEFWVSDDKARISVKTLQEMIATVLLRKIWPSLEVLGAKLDPEVIQALSPDPSQTTSGGLRKILKALFIERSLDVEEIRADKEGTQAHPKLLKVLEVI